MVLYFYSLDKTQLFKSSGGVKDKELFGLK